MKEQATIALERPQSRLYEKTAATVIARFSEWRDQRKPSREDVIHSLQHKVDTKAAKQFARALDTSERSRKENKKLAVVYLKAQRTDNHALQSPLSQNERTLLTDIRATIADDEAKKQDVAAVFAEHMQEAASDKRAVKIFTRFVSKEKRPRRETKVLAVQYLHEQRKEDSSYISPLSKAEQESLREIRERLASLDQQKLGQKEDAFTGLDRTRLIMKAKSKKMSGLDKEQSEAMYREAGYSDEDISKISGKKMALSAGIGVALTIPSEILRDGSAAQGKLPLLDQIPNADLKWAMAAGAITYVGSLAAVIRSNFKLTEKVGASTFPALTGLYYLSDKMVSNKVRDRLAKGFSMGSDMLLQTAAMATATAASGDLRRAVAVSAITTAFNTITAVGSEVWLRIANRRNKSTIDS